MGSELVLTHEVYNEALEKIAKGVEQHDGKSYTGSFQFKFPDGLNTASVMEICRAVQDSSFESQCRLARICIAGKNVECTCPNGEKEKFCLSDGESSFDAFPLFSKEPFALIALAEQVYGYVVKKSMRLSPAKAEPHKATE